MQDSSRENGSAGGHHGEEPAELLGRSMVRDYLELLRRRWWLPVLGAAIAGGVAFWLQQSYVPRYRAEAVLQRQNEEPALGVLPGLAAAGNGQQQLTADIALIKTQAVLGPAVDSLGLRLRVGADPELRRRLFSHAVVAPDAAPGTYTLRLEQGELRLLDETGRQVANGSLSEPISGAGITLRMADPTLLFEGPLQLTVLRREDVLAQLRRVEVKPEAGNGLVRMSYEDSDPVTAAAVVNGLAYAFREHVASRARGETTRRKEFLSTQLAAVSDSLAAAQGLMDEFQVEAGILNPQAEGETLSGLLLRAQEDARTLRSQERTLARLITTFRADGDGDDAYRQMTVLRDLIPAAPAMYDRLREYQTRRSDLIVGRTEQNPAVLAIDSLISKTKLEMRSIAEETLQLVRQRIQSTDARIGELQLQLGDVPERSSAYGRLEQRVAAIQNMHDVLSEKFYEAQVAEAVQQGNFDIVDPAVVPATPVPANHNRQLLLFVLVGLLVGGGVALLLEAMDTRIRDVDDARRVTRLEVIGLIPAVAAPRRGRVASAIVVDDEKDPAGEAFRKIRTTLRFMRAEYPKVIAVTSAAPAEGKSLVAANLAASLAQQGGRILLIDADMRRPSQHRLFSMRVEPGLSDVLVGQSVFEEIVRTHKTHRVSVLTCGTKTTAPAELLSSRAFSELLRKARSLFDTVVIDTPPILAVADSGVIAAGVDGILVVVRSQQTSRFELARAVDQLRQIGAPMLGTVINGVPRNNRYGRYSGYAAYYGYAYEHSDYTTNGDAQPKPGRIRRILTSSGR